MTPTDVLKWKSHIEKRGRGITEVSQKIASRAYLSTLFSAAANNPDKMPQPSAATVKKLASELSMTIGALMGEDPIVVLNPSPGYDRALDREASRIYADLINLVHTRMTQNGHRPSVEDVLIWWRSTNGRLSDSGGIGEAFDLIEVPDNETNKVRPHRVGERSMAGTFFEEDRTARLQRVVDNMSQEGQATLAASYREASLEHKPVFSGPLSLMVSAADICEINYLRLQLPVTATNGSPFIASYCFSI